MKKIVSLILAAILCMAITACRQTNSNVTNPDNPDSSNPVETSADRRQIIDLAGNEVEIPAAADIKRVVIIAPPVMSFVVETIPSTEMIVGINSRSFSTSNTQIVEKVFPNWQTADTSFIDASFTVNKEALLKLNPDIIFYYGNMQKQGLGEVAIPSIDFRAESNDPQDVSIAWDNLLREIFDLPTSGGQQAAWDRTNEKLGALLANQTEEKTALCVFSNLAGAITVCGTNAFDAYAQSFFEMAGIRNAAVGIDGTAEVSMEQIYEWDPDMIIVFQDVPAKAIIGNSIEGQDWSILTAWKNGAVYDVPRTTFSWIVPSADAALTPLWLVSKAYPDLFSEQEMRTEIMEYYKTNYGITLSDTDIDSILDYRVAKGS